MADPMPGMRNHYDGRLSIERLQLVLDALAPHDQRLSPEQTSPFDQFHTRGLAATLDLVEMSGITAGQKVLDIGAGLGGTARLVAARCRCRVVGIDLSERFVEAARYLNGRTAKTQGVTFQVGDALGMPFRNGTFDAALLQHVAMNIEDRGGLYDEVARVLMPVGRLAIHDVVLRDGEPIYPLPWAPSGEMSFLLTAKATWDAIERAGFHLLEWRDESAPSMRWLEQLGLAKRDPSFGLAAALGPELVGYTANLARNLSDGRLGVVSAVFQLGAGARG